MKKTLALILDLEIAAPFIPGEIALTSGTKVYSSPVVRSGLERSTD